LIVPIAVLIAVLIAITIAVPVVDFTPLTRLENSSPRKNTMGLILSLIKQEKEIPFVDISFNATRKDLEPTITVDLEKHLELLKSYSGCAEEIRSAISQPNPQSEENAYKVLVPAIQKLQQLYEFCQSVGKF
jgi:hypothetical protein